MKNQGLNPFLPSWEYIPDSEPYVFNNRVYIYGSHDRFNGYVYCLNDYVSWSAPVDDLSDWRYEGIIYEKTQDPLNEDGRMCLYAPDITVGPDGRYYLYYVLDHADIVSVAVCDKPAGKFEFHGYVKYEDGTYLGERDGDQPQFDPAVMTEKNLTYMYTGFCGFNDSSRSGAMVTVLGPDMLTIVKSPEFIVPSKFYSQGSSFEGNEFFEASSIRKIDDTYYFIYSSVAMHELCYATSKYPTKEFAYGGILVSNADMDIDTYKPAKRPMFYGGNNHGSIVEILDKWYVFYHRHTNGTNFSRQGCIEPISLNDDGSIAQAEMTSCGPNRGPLVGKGEYPAYLACNLFCNEESMFTDWTGSWMNNQFPKITQDGKDGDQETGYIANMKESATAGFKYFNCQDISKVKVKVRGYARGAYEVRTAWDGMVLGKIDVVFANIWTEFSADIAIPDGIHALYFTYTGRGSSSLASFTLL